MQSLSKSQQQFFFFRIEKSILKFIWNLKGPGIVKTTFQEKNRVGGLTLSDFETYYKATVIKAVWYWHKDGHIDQRNRIEILETNPCICDQMIFDKGAKTMR